MIKGSTLVIAVSIASLALNFTYQLVLSRRFIPETYAEVAFSLSIISVLGLLAFPIRVDVLNFASSARTDGREVFLPGLKKYIQSILFITAFVTGVLVASCGFLSLSAMTLFSIGLNMFPLMVAGYVAGSLLASRRIASLAIVGVIYSVGKLLSGLAVAWLGLSVSAAVALLGLSSTIVALIASCAIGDCCGDDAKFQFRKSLSPMFGYLSVIGLGQSDIVALGFIESRELAGSYAVSAILGKLVLIVAIAVSDVSHESIIRLRNSDRDLERIRLQGQILILVIGLAWGVIMSFAGVHLTRSFVSQHFQGSPLMMGGVALIALLQGLIVYAGYFHIAGGQKLWMLVPVIASVLVVCANYAIAKSSVSMIAITLIILVTCLIVLEVVKKS